MKSEAAEGPDRPTTTADFGPDADRLRRNDRRLRIIGLSIHISVSDWIKLLQALPADAWLAGVDYDFAHQRSYFLFWSATFSRVEEGERIPEMRAVFKAEVGVKEVTVTIEIPK